MREILNYEITLEEVDDTTIFIFSYTIKLKSPNFKTN